jgi:hypothetical protein
MKFTMLRTVAVAGLLLMLASVSAMAQTGRIEASIPFDFVAGETKLKAGDYTVKRISKDALLIRSTDNKQSAIVSASPSLHQTRSDAPERLSFKRYGDQYFLTQVWTNRTADGQELSPSKTEQRLAKQFDKTRKPGLVEIVARTK